MGDRAYRWAVRPAWEGHGAVRVAADDGDRLGRVIGGYAGAAVAVHSTWTLLTGALPPAEATATASLGVAGIALLLSATGRDAVARVGGRAGAAIAVAVAAVAIVAGAPAAAAATVLTLAGGTLLTLAGRRSPAPPAPAPAPPAPPAPAPAAPAPAAPTRQPVAGEPALERPALTHMLLESIDEATMLLDSNHRVLDVNRRWRELTGHRSEDAVGQRPPYTWAPDPGSGDRLLHRVDGTGVPVVTKLAPVPDADGRPRAYLATYLDISERTRTEEALADRAAELEHGNARLREANTRLESALTFKNDLTSMLSHDMAQPVSSIASLSELLTSAWGDLDEDVRLDLATKIDRNINRLIRMMDDLSLLFRLDTGAVTARRTPVPVREVVESVTAGLEATGIEVGVDEGLSALVDRQHLWHVVRNLVGNAVKYGNPPIEVLAHRAGDRVVLIVQDRGAGIPADLVPKLFDRFMRGAGLGLFIVRHLVQANGGSVRYERAEPQGARLVVELEADT
jgi:signal transduction histidine kinase